MTYNPANPPSSLPPALQQYLVQELRRISNELRTGGSGGGTDPEPEPGTQNVVFNGSNGRLENLGTFLIAESNNAEMLFSCWTQSISNLNNAGLLDIAVGTGGLDTRIAIKWNGNNVQADIRIQLGSTDNSNIVNTTTAAMFDRTENHHILVARNGGTLQVYVDDVDAPLLAAPATTFFQWQNINASHIGGQGGVYESKNSADVWLYCAQYLDIDIEANRRLFIDDSGEPVWLGNDGEIPLGSPPHIYVGGTMLAADWNAGTNLGTAGDYDHAGDLFTDVEL